MCPSSLQRDNVVHREVVVGGRLDIFPAGFPAIRTGAPVSLYNTSPFLGGKSARAMLATFLRTRARKTSSVLVTVSVPLKRRFSGFGGPILFYPCSVLGVCPLLLVEALVGGFTGLCTTVLDSLDILTRDTYIRTVFVHVGRTVCSHAVFPPETILRFRLLGSTLHTDLGGFMRWLGDHWPFILAYGYIAFVVGILLKEQLWRR
jgi:hypothetical protein